MKPKKCWTAAVLIGLLFGLGFSEFLWAESAMCEIKLGRGSKASQVYSAQDDKDFLNIGGPWQFIRWTKGPCSFHMGRNLRLAYGSDINKKSAIGAKGGGGDVRSSITSFSIRRARSTECFITLGDGGVRQTFYGPTNGLITEITAWSSVTETHGPCEFRVFNKPDRTGDSRSYLSGITDTLHVGWRIRSLEISKK